MMQEYLQNLNEPQFLAVTAGPGPTLVLAGPGSGKTGVLTRRVVYLLREVSVRPSAIMAVTFTNKASAEMRKRIEGFLQDRVAGLQIGTFHATCARLLRIEAAHTGYREDYVIYDSDDQLSAVRQAMSELEINAQKYSPQRVLAAISAAKNEFILSGDFVASDYFGEIVARVYPRYQRLLRDSSAMDFDDLLVQMALLLRENDAVRAKYQKRFEHILVDEFQDTNMVQYELVKLFGAPQNNIFAVGDEDQSIYAFRGANYRNVLQFRHDFPDARVILLEQNYRSTQVVLDVARAVIDHNLNRTPKKLFTTRQGGEKVGIHEAYDDEYEARYVTEQVERLRKENGYPYREFAVMYRTNAQSRALERGFMEAGIPYRLVGGVGFYKRREVRDLLAYLRLVNNLDDRISLLRVVNVPRRGIGEKTMAEFMEWANKVEGGFEQAFSLAARHQAQGLSGRSAKLFGEFAQMLLRWRARLAEHHDPVQLFDNMLSDLRFGLYLQDISDGELEAAERGENVQELRGLLLRAREEEMPLNLFLAEQALMSDIDEGDERDEERVTLLTLHAAKGLEFPVVFITGVEDGLLPHSRSFEDPEGMEEERRLFYVGITRAKDQLFLSYAFRRTLFGGANLSDVSRFLEDVPPELTGGMPGRLSEQQRGRSYLAQTTWDRSSALSRLSRDLDAERANRNSAPSNPEIRSKIIPFPGANRPAQQEPPVLKYRSGMRVQHAAFGFGTVIDSEAVSDDEMVTVVFTDRRYGLKRLFASMADLTIL